MKMSRFAALGCFFLICSYQLGKAQDISDLSLASEETILTSPQAVAMGNAIESLPTEIIRTQLVTWIKAAQSGNYERAANASLAILCAAMRSDGWEIVSDRYPQVLDLINSHYPAVQQRSLLIAVHDGIREPGSTALALRSLVSHRVTASTASREAGSNDHEAAELGLRASAVQELLRLEPGNEAAHDAIDRLLSEDLSTNDRLIVLQSLPDERPAGERTLAILLRALDDTSSPLREAAVRSLERISGSGTDIIGRAGSKLLQMSIDDPEPRVRAAAKEALSHPPATRAPLQIGISN
jgi:hypothetical protein